jgi:hypothetical protein
MSVGLVLWYSANYIYIHEKFKKRVNVWSKYKVNGESRQCVMKNFIFLVSSSGDISVICYSSGFQINRVKITNVTYISRWLMTYATCTLCINMYTRIRVLTVSQLAAKISAYLYVLSSNNENHSATVFH